jgi:hypothetical protein
MPSSVVVALFACNSRLLQPDLLMRRRQVTYEMVVVFELIVVLLF